VEAVFLEVTQRLSPPAGAGLSAKQADALQHLAFDWILYADKYVDPRFQELALYRDQVSSDCCSYLEAASRRTGYMVCYDTWLVKPLLAALVSTPCLKLTQAAAELLCVPVDKCCTP